MCYVTAESFILNPSQQFIGIISTQWRTHGDGSEYLGSDLPRSFSN